MRAPACRFTLTGEVASAFMTTTAQAPERRSQFSSCSPGPVAVAAQKVCCAGLEGALAPATSRYSARKGLNLTSTISVRRTPARYVATSARGAIPMKISLPGSVEEPRSSTLPAMSTGTPSSMPPPVMRSSRGVVSA